MLVSRDVYSRTELHREQVPADGQVCRFCAGLNKRGKLYQYRVETDAGRMYKDSHLFCSASCRDAYYG